MEACPLEVSVTEVCPFQVSTLEVRPLEVSTPEARSFQVSTLEVCPSEVGVPQVEALLFSLTVGPGAASEHRQDGLISVASFADESVVVGRVSFGCTSSCRSGSTSIEARSRTYAVNISIIGQWSRSESPAIRSSA
jgi:hypothetical protein